MTTMFRSAIAVPAELGEIEYCGDAMIVARAWQPMDEPLQVVLEGQYVWREIPVKVKAAAYGIAIAAYWTSLREAKGFIAGYVGGITDAEARKAL
jgi:hypothetical protein